MRPVIGLTASFDEDILKLNLRLNYMDMVRAAGGNPFIIPTGATGAELEKLLGMCGGVMLTGGNDVAPTCYGEAALECCGDLTPDRDSFEAELIRRAVGRDMPVFGICRGIQILNVALGGSLYQDLACQIGQSAQAHRQAPPYKLPAHVVKLVSDTPLSALMGKAELYVNSIHHQGIKRLAASLKAMAYAPEGFPEAVYMPDCRYVRAVQWHPEYMCEAGAEAGRRMEQMRILDEFIKACAPA